MSAPTASRRGRLVRAAAVLVTTIGLSATVLPPAWAGGYPSDEAKPNLAAALAGYSSLWKSSGKNDGHGKVKNTTVLRWNDRVVSWVNQQATPQQRFRALQDAEYLASDDRGYDQSLTIADGLGERLGALYLQGRITGELPLTTELLNNTTGTVGNYVSTGKLKSKFSYPRPFLRTDSKAARAPGDSSSCKSSKVNASSLARLRRGQPWADAKGNLRITRVPAAVDVTKRYTDRTVKLSAEYGSSGLCRSGSFPSGHTTDAYSSGLMLATMLPELAPSILARTSEAANNRLVLGVHYPLDVVGGRINGQAVVTTRWADKKFRNAKILPAREELVNYLESACGARLAVCAASDQPYRNDPYAGAAAPGGTSQVVTSRASALAVYTERLGYGFAPSGSALEASLPSKAEYLLLTAFPTLTMAQRRAVLAQTQTRSGHPLDTSKAHAKGKAPGSWQRLDLAAAMSAVVVLQPDGTVKVSSVGGAPTVLQG